MLIYIHLCRLVNIGHHLINLISNPSCQVCKETEREESLLIIPFFLPFPVALNTSKSLQGPQSTLV